MKILTMILTILLSVSAFAHEGHKERGRYTDEHGVPYGGQNPPVGVRSNAHCMYSAWGCSGAGGSTGPRGYSYVHSPYGHQPYGYGTGYGCGSHSNRGGQVNVHDGRTTGSVYFNQSQTNCNPNGTYQNSNRGGSVGVVDGRASGGVYFNQSKTD